MLLHGHPRLRLRAAHGHYSTHLRNKTIALRVECVRKAELAQRRGGILPRKQIPLLRDFAERFLHTIKVERRSNTHRNYLSCVRNLEPTFGSRYLDAHPWNLALIREFFQPLKKHVKSFSPLVDAKPEDTHKSQQPWIRI